jgi:two-component system C4-dicarboxylate transport sensor histidine kinase DctB
VQRELEHKVAERTAELESANRQLLIESSERAASEARYRQSREELAQVNRLGTLGQVTAGVAHEINQPLAAIRTFAENAASFLAKGKPDKIAQNLTHIVSLTERIATITSELRNFARRKTPAIGATSLADAIEASLLLVKHRIVSSKVQIIWDKAAAAVPVRADRIRLEQIFVNLVQNSLDALTGRTDGKIELSFRNAGDQVIILIADNGPGLPPDLRASIFMPFSTGKEEGLGLGLAIVRDIARAFGGDIALVDGPGARFELRLMKA